MVLCLVFLEESIDSCRSWALCTENVRASSFLLTSATKLHNIERVFPEAQSTSTSWRERSCFLLDSTSQELIILRTGLIGDQLVVDTLLFHELLVGAHLDNAAILESTDDVSITHSGQPVGNHYGGATLSGLC